MRSILRGRNVIPDTWHYVEEPGSSDVADLVVPLDQLLGDADGLARRTGRLGVKLAPADDVAKLAPHLSKLALVAIEFTAFGEGRGYSQAHLLRQRYGYRGELRAVGIVKRDQIFFMARAGFDSFELSPGESPEAAIEALGTFTVAYQDGLESLFSLKRRAIGAAG
jgi:uncharacterized protein (DUF934 family)